MSPSYRNFRRASSTRKLHSMVRPADSAARRQALTREMSSTRKAMRSRPRHSLKTRVASISAGVQPTGVLPRVVDLEAAPEAASLEWTQDGGTTTDVLVVTPRHVFHPLDELDREIRNAPNFF